MHYRTFRGSTVREALGAVKAALGPEALVLSTRMVRASGVNGWMGARVVEITAATERTTMSDSRIPRTTGRPVGDGGRHAVDTFGLDAVDPTPSVQSAGQPSAAARSFASRLEASGLEPALALKVAAHPAVQDRGAGQRQLHRAVADVLAPLTAPDDGFTAAEVFLGPPGVGKTTTVAKIAAQARAAAHSRLCLVAADGFRVGAVEQLRLYADILDTPFVVARSGSDLEAALADANRSLIVDTAGRSPNDTGNADILETLQRHDKVRRHLVLPADSSPAQARRIIDRFRASRPDRLVLTHLDDAATLAPLVGVITELNVPVSYLAFGQNVPDDLQRATPEALTGWVLGDTTTGAQA